MAKKTLIFLCAALGIAISGMAVMPLFRMPESESFAAGTILDQLRGSPSSVPLRPAPSLRALRARAATSPPQPVDPLLSPQLKQLRNELVRDGAIQDKDFRKLRTADDIQVFLGKVFDQQVKKKKISQDEAVRFKKSLRHGYEDLAKGTFFSKGKKR